MYMANNALLAYDAWDAGKAYRQQHYAQSQLMVMTHTEPVPPDFELQVAQSIMGGLGASIAANTAIYMTMSSAAVFKTLFPFAAREVAKALPPADRIFMNLPHGAKGFLDVAARLAKPKATVHYHEILPADSVAARSRALEAEMAGHGWPCRVTVTRVVRNYSPQEAHVAFDLEGL